MDCIFEKVGFTYQKGTPLRNRGSFMILKYGIKEEVTALVGIQAVENRLFCSLNALMKPTEGTVDNRVTGFIRSENQIIKT